MGTVGSQWCRQKMSPDTNAGEEDGQPLTTLASGGMRTGDMCCVTGTGDWLKTVSSKTDESMTPLAIVWASPNSGLNGQHAAEASLTVSSRLNCGEPATSVIRQRRGVKLQR